MQVHDTNRHRRDSSLLALACLVLQIALAPNLALANGHINFALVFCAVISLTVGGSWGVLCGFVAGLVFDLCTTGPVGLMAFLLTVASFVMGMESRNRLQDDSSAAMILFFIVCFGVCFAYNLAMLLVGQASSVVDVLFLRSLPTFLLTSLTFLPFAYVRSRGSLRLLGLGAQARRHGGRRGLRKR
ncbi:MULTISPECIES: rod shape-determining protein MreD [Olsenella]|uniref:rod shape-determining protein MreD n=1 Tax=Olsenella TaxID=133925 RepID=UPI00071D8E69|nr:MULTISPECIES: rod shape-determining protein MreD [Olsenella]OFK24314.1 rod shape-determining protein MreD [Olsenella sp. HMSC062G07]